MQHPRARDYRHAGFAGEVGFGRRAALVVVDLVNAYFDPASPMYAAVEDVLASNHRVIAAARAAQAPVFFTRQLFEEPDDDGVYVRKVPALRLLRPGSPLAELHAELVVEPGETIVKHYPSAFHETGLADRLEQRGVDTVLITGLTTSGCVRATAMDALLHDLHGIVVREAVGDRDASVHQANLFDIGAKLADVCGEHHVLEWLAVQGKAAPAR